jgi:hypothetical protein
VDVVFPKNKRFDVHLTWIGPGIFEGDGPKDFGCLRRPYTDTFIRHTCKQKIKKGGEAHIIQKVYTVNKTNPQQLRIVYKLDASVLLKET